MEVRATRPVAAAPERVFAFLDRLDRHFHLLGSRAELRVDGSTGALVRLRGPAGLRRSARTSVVHSRAPESIVGLAVTNSGSRGVIRWSIRAAGTGSIVEVLTRADMLAPLDALLLALGGRRWLARSLELALAALDDHMQRPSGEAEATTLVT